MKVCPIMATPAEPQPVPRESVVMSLVCSDIEAILYATLPGWQR